MEETGLAGLTSTDSISKVFSSLKKRSILIFRALKNLRYRIKNF